MEEKCSGKYAQNLVSIKVIKLQSNDEMEYLQIWLKKRTKTKKSRQEITKCYVSTRMHKIDVPNLITYQTEYETHENCRL